MIHSRLFSEETIRRVADASDITEVAGAYLTLRKTGSTYTGLCPFHQEKTPSFTVTPARQSYKCFGCGVGGDVFSFVSRIENVGFPDAVVTVAQRAGIALDGVGESIGIPMNTKPRRNLVAPSEPPKVLRLPVDLRRGNPAELRAVAVRRGLSLAGLDLADERGLILFGTTCHVPCWIVTDSARVSAQARRVDGGIFPAFGDLGQRKAHTLRGSRQAWPIGAREADPFPFVALVEGGPDLAAAHNFIAAENRHPDTAAVAMLGAANHRIPDDALLYLANKRVRIYPHTDTAGQSAASHHYATTMCNSSSIPRQTGPFRSS